MSWHYLMKSALFKSYLAWFCHFWRISNLFVFLITLSVLMVKKWNLIVILSLKHNELLRGLSLEVIWWLNVEKLVMIFSVISGFWIVTGRHHIWSWWVYLNDPPNFWVSYHWPVGCVKREENVINITKPWTHKAAGSGINEMLFSIFS